MSSSTVGLYESVPLVAALAWRLADEVSVRALVIKGSPAIGLGVRSQRPSVDADLWVDVNGFDRYLRRLIATGWQRYGSQPEAVGWGHAVTMTHPEWPCTIDVHRRFPGFLTDDSTSFELAWRTRSTARMAHQDVAVPSRVVAAAITVLHSARSRAIVGVDADLSCALATASSFSSVERDELTWLASATGSAEPLAELLLEAGCEASRSSAPDVERLEEWRIRLSVGSEPGGGWLLALRGASWPRRAGLLAAAARPCPKDYAESGAERTARGFLSASIYRWRRAARALPGAVRALRQARTARSR